MPRTNTAVQEFPKLPCDVDAERSILGTILLDNQALAVAAETVGPEDFFLSNHIHIYERMLDMGAKSIPIDLYTLKDELEKVGDLEAAGGAPYISALMDGRPRVTNTAHYCGIVKQKSSLRSLIHAANTIQRNAFEGREDVSSIVQRASTSLANIGTDCAPGEAFLEMFHSMTDFENSPGLTFAIDGFLQTRAATMIAGLAGHDKTFVMLSMVKALLNGGKLWDLFDVKECAARVVYMIPESSIEPFGHRLKLFGLLEHVRTERLLVRTLSKGTTPSLSDPRILRAVQGSDVFLDTAIRFSTEGSENEATDNQRGLAADIFAMLSNGARLVTGAHHAPKSFAKETVMTLENILRGSGDIGAMLATCWGCRQLDHDRNIVYLQNVKPRDFEPCRPFQLIGRPYIDDEGDFRIYRRPGECANLAEYIELAGRNKGGGASKTDRLAKALHMELVRQYLDAEPGLSDNQIVDKLKKANIDVSRITILRYRKELDL